MILNKFIITQLSVIVLLLLFGSCKQSKDVVAPNVNSSDTKLKGVEQRLKHIALIMSEVSKKPEVIDFINQSIAAEYYQDERILLKDLWNPEQSKALQNYVKVKSIKNLSLFRDVFQDIYKNDKYPQAKSFSNNLEKSNEDIISYLLSNDVSIYYPYSKSEEKRNNKSSIESTTISYNTVEEQDSNIGYLMDKTGTLQTVIVDDAYATQNRTYIVSQEGFDGNNNLIISEGGGGGSTTPSNPLYPSPNQPDPDIYYTPNPNKDGDPDLPTYKKVHLIKIAEVQLKEQLDPFFGLKNSGGSEVVFVRAQAFFQNAANPTAGVGDLVMPELFFTRQAIKDHRWVAMNSVIDSDWVLAESQNIFGAYEADNAQEKIKITGKVKFKIFGTVEVELSAEYEKSFGSKNDRLYNLDQGRTSYFVNAKNPALYELRNGWAVYTQSEGLFKFTMPYFVSE